MAKRCYIMSIVKTGIDCIRKYQSLLSEARLGLITGASGISADGRYSIDILCESYNLTTLFAPEHGIRGERQPGEPIASSYDQYTNLPVVSLFAEDTITNEYKLEEAHMPPCEAMDNIDMMLFDIQDAGARFFTFSSTLYYAMIACGQAGKTLVVLDRPNPIDGIILEGPCLQPQYRSFIGMYPSPIRHGFTMGELSRYFQNEMGINCDLQVIKMEGWRRDMLWNETGLPFINPSPNLPSMEALMLYCGTCLFAGTNVSEGRGTANPFTMVGAPYIRPDLLAKQMNSYHLPGVLFVPISFVPMFSKYKGKVCGGVRIHITDLKSIRAVELGVYLLRTIQMMYPKDFSFNPPVNEARWHVDLNVGNSSLRNDKLSIKDLIAIWEQEAETFRTIHDRYCIY